MSSPSLRHAAQRGVDIEEAGHAETAIAVVFLGPLLVLCTLTATVNMAENAKYTLSRVEDWGF